VQVLQRVLRGRQRSSSRRGDRMRRREFLGVLGAVAWPLAAGAQQHLARVGVLLNGAAAAPKDLIIFSELARLGYVYGLTIVFETRAAEGDLTRLPVLVRTALARCTRAVPDPPCVASLSARCDRCLPRGRACPLSRAGLVRSEPQAPAGTLYVQARWRSRPQCLAMRR
jgi:hypothetical protein